MCSVGAVCTVAGYSRPPWYCAGMGLYCFLGLLMDGPATLATASIGLPIAPHFDEPYKSTSVSTLPAFPSPTPLMLAGVGGRRSAMRCICVCC